MKKSYIMPYTYFRDNEWKLLEKTQPHNCDPENYFQAHLWQPPGQNEKWLLNQKNRKLLTKNGWFKPPYYHGDDLEDKHFGEDVLVICPGPSLQDFDLKRFNDTTSITVNSAGFKYHGTYWAVYESNYVNEVLVGKKIPQGRDYVMSARVAVRWRDINKRTNECNAIYIPRFEERRNMPCRTPGVGVMSALLSAWWIGAKRIFIVGQDLSRPDKKGYVSGVPSGQTGQTMPFDDQIKAMKQFTLPDVEIYNCSPHSADKLPFPFIEKEKFYEELEAPKDKQGFGEDLQSHLSSEGSDLPFDERSPWTLR